jgi:hypothetical protein
LVNQGCGARSGVDGAARRSERVLENERVGAAAVAATEAARERGRKWSAWVSFMCECGAEACAATMALDVDVYHGIRMRGPGLYIVHPGHEQRAAEEIVSRTWTHLVVRSFRNRAEDVAATDSPPAS